MKIVVTGCGGFIGSHLTEALLKEGHDVIGIDDFSSGKREFLTEAFENPRFVLHEEDVLQADLESLMRGAEVVYHLQANPDVRLGAEDTKVHLDQNIIATHRVLEAMRKVGIKDMVFTSTSTVYGEAKTIPTPENYGPLFPISLYGASKLACEALISSYASTFEMRGIILRFANVVGPRSTHGVTFDFVRKLRADPSKLTILGDGTQTKSYFHVSDCVRGIMDAYEKTPREERVAAYNMGSEDAVDVNTVAKAVMEAMGLERVEFEYTGGVQGGRGWKGDVKVMLLDISALKGLGWKPTMGSREAIYATAKHLVEHME